MGGINGFDKDGQPLAVGSAAEADKLYSEGKLKFVRGQKINVKTYDGRVVPLNAEDYHIAREKGAVIVSDDEARTERKAEEIRDAGALAAFGRGAASTVVDPLLAVGANLGVTKDFRDISRDALKNQATDLEASEKEFAGATTGGKLFGYVAPTLLTAGANLGVRAGAQVTAKGLAAATAQRATVAGISNVAGETAAQLAVKGMAKLGAGKVATNVAKWSAQGAAEGVIQGASDAMVQATLDNPDKVAESMLASVGPSALYGAAGNVILGGIGKGIARGATASKDAIKGLAYRATRGAAQELGEVNPAVLDAAERKVSAYLGSSPEPSVVPDAPPIKTVPLPGAPAAAPAGAADGGIPGQPAAAAGAVDPDSLFVKFTAKVTGASESDVAGAFDPAAAAAIDNPVDFVEKGAEGLVGRLRKTFSGADDIDEVTSTHGAQYDSLRNLAKDTDANKARDFAVAHATRVKNALGELADSSDEWKQLAGMKKMATYVADHLDNDIERAALSDNPAGELAVVLDKFKTNIQWSVSKRPGRAASPELRRAWDELRKISDMQQGELAAANDAFGDAAADWYAKKNAAWAKQLGWKAKFGKTFLDIPEQDGWDYVQDFAPDKAVSYMDKAGEFEASGKERALREAIEGRMERMDAIVAEEGFDAGVRQKAKKIAEELRESLDFHDKYAAVNVNRIKADKVAAQAQQRASGIKFAGEVAGSMFGPLGMLLGGKLAEAASRPDRIANTLAAVRTMVGNRSGAVLGAAGGVSNRARGIFEKAGKVAPRAGRALAGGALFLAYKDKVREIVDATTNTATVPELDAITPGLSGALAAKRATALDFLKSKAPTGGMGKGMFAHLETPKVTDYEARRFLSYVRGVEDPMGVLAEVQSGNISPESIEAVRTVYPETFAEMQQVVMEQLSGLEEPPPYESRIELFRLFGIAADPSLSPEFLASMQSLSPGPVPGQNPQKPKAGSSSSRLAAMSVSQTERTLTR
jgi:hypothetical protein